MQHSGGRQAGGSAGRRLLPSSCPPDLLPSPRTCDRGLRNVGCHDAAAHAGRRGRKHAGLRSGRARSAGCCAWQQQRFPGYCLAVYHPISCLAVSLPPAASLNPLDRCAPPASRAAAPRRWAAPAGRRTPRAAASALRGAGKQGDGGFACRRSRRRAVQAGVGGGLSGSLARKLPPPPQAEWLLIAGPHTDAAHPLTLHTLASTSINYKSAHPRRSAA